MTTPHRPHPVLAIASGLILLAAGAIAAPVTYQIDPAHSAAQFSVRHLMISNVRGEFNKVSGTVVWDSANLSASKIEAVIEVDTINTREPKRDAHLKTADFFDAAKYPQITFRSSEVKRNNGKVQVRGNLAMHGVTKQVVLDVDGPTAEIKDPSGNMRVGASATTKISRKEWGLTWNRVLEAGGLSVADEVEITLDLEALRK